jgi:RNA polymerase sigma factor (sigma-70 family)
MKELVLRAGRGDVKAQEELIRVLSPRIERIVHHYSWINGVDSDDLRQEAFIAIIEGLDRVDVEIGSSTEYLLKFARWRLLDCLKKILKQKCEEPQEEPETTASQSSAEASIELLDTHLNETQKEILKYLMEGYTWREIGDLMGFSAANVSHHLKQIRRVYG